MINIEYIGWAGYTNYGDDFIKDIILRFGFKECLSDIRMYGGGTLLPVSDKLKDIIVNKKIKDIICFGTGVNDNVFEIDNYEEYMKETKKELENSEFIGLRCEKDKELLGMGEVIGDPMFSLRIPENITKDDNLVILNVGQSYGKCWGGVKAEFNCFLTLLDFVKNYIIGELKKEVIVVSLWSPDNVLAITASNYLNAKFFVNTIENMEVLGLFSTASAVISYKLHGMITALTVNTPVLPIEYRPKIRNVAKDFGIDNLVIKIDEVTEEKLKEKFEMLKDWNYKKVKDKKNEYGLKTFNFFNKIKEKYGEN